MITALSVDTPKPLPAFYFLQVILSDEIHCSSPENGAATFIYLLLLFLTLQLSVSFRRSVIALMDPSRKWKTQALIC